MSLRFTTPLQPTDNELASASTLSVPNSGIRFHVTGNETIETIDTGARGLGQEIWLTFDEVLTLTHGESLDLGGANVETEAGQDYLFVVTGENAVRRVAIGGGNIETTEIINPENIEVAGGTASASSVLGGGYGADSARDGSSSSIWHTSGNNNLPQWIQVEWDTPQLFDMITLRARNDVGGNHGAPKAFSVRVAQAGEDFEGTEGVDWFELHSENIATDPYSAGTVAVPFSFENSTAYKAARLFITNTFHGAGDGYTLAIAEWGIFKSAGEEPVGRYTDAFTTKVPQFPDAAAPNLVLYWSTDAEAFCIKSPSGAVVELAS